MQKLSATSGDKITSIMEPKILIVRMAVVLVFNMLFLFSYAEAMEEEEKRKIKEGVLTDEQSAESSPLHGQFIFPFQSQHCHSPSIVQTKDGNLIASWYQGSGEKWADDVAIWAATGTPSKPSQVVEWQKPFVLADTPNIPDMNPVVFLDHQKKIWLAWSSVLANEFENTLINFKNGKTLESISPKERAHNTLHIYIPSFAGQFLYGLLDLAAQFSSFYPKIAGEIQYKNLEWLVICIGLSFVLLACFVVYGLNWMLHRMGIKRLAKLLTLAVMLLIGAGTLTVWGIYTSLDEKSLYRMGWATRSQPLLLEDDIILLPLYSDTFSVSLIARSSDNGASWKFSEPLIGYGNIQPSLLQKDDGTVVAYMRDNGLFGRIRVSQSFDQGKTWGPVRSTQLPNPGSSIAALELDSGNWVMAYNDLVKGRHRLKVSLSTDEGKSWQHHKYLETGVKYQSNYSYPTLIQDHEGFIHCVYTYHESPAKKSIKHTRFSESWLMSEEIPDAASHS